MRDRSLPPISVDADAGPSRAARLGIALPLALIAVSVVVTASLVWLVRVKSTQTEIGYRVHDLRQELVTLEQQRAALEVERTALLRPSRLAHLARTELGLVPADVGSSVPVIDAVDAGPR